MEDIDFVMDAEPLRPEFDAAVDSSSKGDRELWRPSWKCYCCHDSGFILPRLAEKIIRDYKHGKSKFPLCNASRCRVPIGENEELLASINRNVPTNVCDKLDRSERKDWNDYVLKQADLIRSNKDKANNSIEELARSMSLRPKRTSEEEMFAMQKLQNVLIELEA